MKPEKTGNDGLSHPGQGGVEQAVDERVDPVRFDENLEKKTKIARFNN